MFGWQKPCYLLQEGYADTYAELIEETKWANYGRASKNPKCANCMVHSGYEASAVNHTFSSVGGMLATIKAMVFNTYASPKAKQRLDEEREKPHGPLAHLVQLGLAGDVQRKGAA